MLEERNSFIDDIDLQQKKIKRLYRDLSHYKKSDEVMRKLRDELVEKVSRLKHENKSLRLQSDTYFEQWQQHKALNNKISQHIGNKPSSNTYRYFRAKLDALEIKEDE